ncbi:hypothetical protein BLA29_003097, partial [Euroglyphus maynei]
SLTNSYNSNFDVIDSADNNVRTQKKPPSSLSSSFRSTIVPGGAKRNMAIVEPEISSTINNQSNSQQHQQIVSNNNADDNKSQTELLQPQMDSLKSCHSLFDFEPEQRPPSSSTTTSSSTHYDPTKSEYHSKFKDFNEYVYIEGDGFKKGDTLSLKAQQMAHSWFSEVTERTQQACKYRARSRNGATPVNPEYSWNGVQVKDRNDLAALALATRLVIEQKRSERNYSKDKSRSVSAKPHLRHTGQSMNSAPASLQDDRSNIGSSINISFNKNDKFLIFFSIPNEEPRPVTRKPVTKPSNENATTTTTAAKQSNVDRNNNNSRVVSAKKPPQPPTASNQQLDGSKKIWIKPVKKPSSTNDSSAKTTKSSTGKQFDPEPKRVPLHTTQIKSPEQLSGIKSPSPESWKITIEKGGLNWVNGGQTTAAAAAAAAAAATTTAPANFSQTQSLQQNNDQMVRPVPINGISNQF